MTEHTGGSEKTTHSKSQKVLRRRQLALEGGSGVGALAEGRGWRGRQEKTTSPPSRPAIAWNKGSFVLLPRK